MTITNNRRGLQGRVGKQHTLESRFHTNAVMRCEGQFYYALW